MNVAVPVTANGALSNSSVAGFCASDQRARAFPAHSFEQTGAFLRGSVQRASAHLKRTLL